DTCFTYSASAVQVGVQGEVGTTDIYAAFTGFTPFTVNRVLAVYQTAGSVTAPELANIGGNVQSGYEMGSMPAIAVISGTIHGISIVPEPTTMGLLGVSGLMLSRRRFGRQQS
ncbi:MAG: PEP-CTERM sorting domain-containing protein, partial [Phycisphaerae bacterium]|nr:PEP-CTERM sorting domain-containing protein [Phycisphaerae bacterium]